MERREQVRAFIEAQVVPNEPAFAQEDEAADALIRELQAQVKVAGLWAPFIGPEAGGTGTGFMDYVFLNEIIGRSPWGPLVFGCQAPDTGNCLLYTSPSPRD